MGLRSVLVLVVAAVVLDGCSKGAGSSNTADQSSFRQTPDLGGVSKQYVEVEGVGPTRAAAVENALRLAIMQVNGVEVNTSEANVAVTTPVGNSGGDVDISSASFATAVATQSNGVISDFKVVKESQDHEGFLGLGKPGAWRVRIGANVATYKASADANRPRIVVALPRTSVGSFDFGDSDRPANTIQASVRSRIANALAQTNRFAVLDRQFTSEMQSEFDLIGSGTVNKVDTSRLGQMLAADLIVIPTIERMEYNRHATQLRLADRELVSYSGGARISYIVLNAATGQIVLSDTFASDFPSTQPTTLGASVNADGAAETALNLMTQKFVEELLEKTFPIAVIAVSGQNVVLSQGGAAVRQGATYRAVLLGDEMKDPQTGQSLGRTERDFGTILVSRSEPNVSYGTLEGATLSAGQFRPGLIEIREEVTGQAITEGASSSPPPAAPPRAPAEKGASRAAATTDNAVASRQGHADKDW